MTHWHCHDLYQRMPPRAPTGGLAVVIDVLRASTTIVTALANGAAAVRPVGRIDEARSLAARLGEAILGGERGGLRLEGFDLGNSPAEYTADRVAGRIVVITTTNGTAAVAACAAAREVLVGAIVNRSAVAATARRLAGPAGHVHLVCAGTDGAVSAEDVLAAGAILDAAARDAAAADDDLDPAATDARDGFRRLVAARPADVPAALVRAFAVSPGGANLVTLGMADDLGRCARIDTVDLVPRLDRASGEMVPATESG